MVVSVPEIKAALAQPDEIIGKAPFRVLVVEDDTVHYMYVQHILECIFEGRLAIEWAREREAAIDALRGNNFDVCLLDYLIKGANARQILEAVNPGILDTAIIVVSAFEDKDFVLEALRAGADDYVIKGRFTAAELERAIQFSVYRKYKEVMLRRKAMYDPLTGLANRDLLFDRLDEVRKYAKRNRSSFGVALLDIDNLKRVNESYGHEAGDVLIQAVSQAVTNTLRESDVVARLGGDEMVAVLRDVSGRDRLAKVCSNLITAVGKERLFFHGEMVVPSCSIGAVLYPEDGNDPLHLLTLADEAMYRVKRTGGGSFLVPEPPPV